MAKIKFKKIESLDQYPRADRLNMKINLMSKNMEVSYQGRDAKQIEINTALWHYHQALNTAEAQIEALLRIVQAQKAGEDYDEDEYQETYEEDGDEDIRYKIDELKAGLFQAMFKKDEKLMSRYLNQISVLEAKTQKQNETV